MLVSEYGLKSGTGAKNGIPIYTRHRLRVHTPKSVCCITHE